MRRQKYPFFMRKVSRKNCYRVSTRMLKKTKKNRNKTKRIFSKCTTKENAKKQMNLLRAIIYNKNFTYKKRRV